ncbi:MAG: recombination regulator RecX [Lachnospiraceae bacterium]|nr:recombination regulator RecX [Lachnospiraceae bacterium]
MHITRIEALPRKKNKIYIDGEYAFMLYDKDMGIYHLERFSAGDNEDETDIVISDELYEKIMKETVIRRAHQKTLAMLERMDRTEAELRRKMKLDMYSESVADETIGWLKNQHYLDDRRYAESFIRSHIESSSRQELISKLLAKGVAKDIINEAYSACCDEANFSLKKEKVNEPISASENRSDQPEEVNVEQQAAIKALRKKLGSKKVLTPKERMSAIGYMLRKGFRRNEIMAAFDELGISIDYEDMADY